MSEPRLLETRCERGVWRVARKNAPFTPSRGTPEDLGLKDAGNRFDSPDASFGVLYFGTELECCFGEVLAHRRPGPEELALVQKDPRFKLVGKVEAAWREDRSAVQVDVTDPRPFIDVEAADTHTILTEELAAVLADLGAGRLNVASVRGDDRRITRAVSGWVHDQVDDHGLPRYAGVRYLSKVDSAWECWGLFEDTEFTHARTDRIERDMPALTAIRDRYGLLIY